MENIITAFLNLNLGLKILISILIILIIYMIRNTKLGFCLRCNFSGRDIIRRSMIGSEECHQRDHLLEIFRDIFEKSKEKILIFKPQVNLPNIIPGYLYFDFGGYGSWQLNKHDLVNRFNQIHGYCLECKKNHALVGFYTDGYMEFDEKNNYWHLPDKGFESMCKKCAFARIEPILKSFSQDLSFGIDSPYQGDGLYITVKKKDGFNLKEKIFPDYFVR